MNVLTLIRKAVFFGLMVVSLVGCATWAHTKVDLLDKSSNTLGATNPASIMVSHDDLDRQYKVIADIAATVNKTTVFHPDPTREHVNQKLKEKAASLGADAVILVRYGETGVSMMSWGSLEGKGRAVRFFRNE